MNLDKLAPNCLHSQYHQKNYGNRLIPGLAPISKKDTSIWSSYGKFFVKWKKKLHGREKNLIELLDLKSSKAVMEVDPENESNKRHPVD